MQIKFGTDGWRGIIARDFTFDNVAHVTQAFCDVFLGLGVPKVVYIGYDRRFLAGKFAQEAAQVLAANGVGIHLSKQFCPTPCISWMTKQFGAGAGIMITASHNPFDWNGIKFKEPDGGSASIEYTAPIEKQIAKNLEQGIQPKRISLESARQKGLLHDFDPMGPYLEQLQSLVDIEAIRKAGWNIVADTMYGAGSGFFSAALQDGIREIHADMNPSFGLIQPEPIAKNLLELIESVAHRGVDVGLATDGDADRIGAVDEEGRFVDSHHIFALIMRHLIEKRGMTGGVVKTLSTTQMIDRLGEKYNVPIYQTPVGFKHICSKFKEIYSTHSKQREREADVARLAESKAKRAQAPILMGGEESGGIAIYDHIPERDGMLSGLLLLEIMTEARKPLGKIIKKMEMEIGCHRFRRDDIDLSEEKIAEVRNVIKDFSQKEVAGTRVTEVIRIDGCRFNLEDGSWILMRPSGTEPLIRIYAEANSDERVNELLAAVKKELPL